MDGSGTTSPVVSQFLLHHTRIPGDHDHVSCDAYEVGDVIMRCSYPSWIVVSSVNIVTGRLYASSHPNSAPLRIIVSSTPSYLPL